jgi:Uma2 family endonuclease
MESDHQCVEAVAQLHAWARRDGRGKAFGTSAEFILPTGAALAPDAAWVSNRRIAQVPKPQVSMNRLAQKIRVPANRISLIHPDEKTIYLYRAGQRPGQLHTGSASGAESCPEFVIEVMPLRQTYNLIWLPLNHGAMQRIDLQ